MLSRAWHVHCVYARRCELTAAELAKFRTHVQQERDCILITLIACFITRIHASLP